MIYEALGYALAILCAMALPLLDRMRGSDTGAINRNICKVLMGVTVFVIIFGAKIFGAVSLTMFLMFLAAYLLSCSIGLGAPVGAGLQNMTNEQYKNLVRSDREKGLLEWYVRGSLENSWLMSLTVRGMLWGLLPALILAAFGFIGEAFALFIAYTAAMPLGVLAATALTGTIFEDWLKAVSMFITREADLWGNQEILRGFFASLVLLVFYFLSTMT